MVSTNSDLSFYNLIPQYIGFQDPSLKYISVFNAQNCQSFRKPWIDDCFGKLDRLIENKTQSTIGTILTRSDCIKLCTKSCTKSFGLNHESNNDSNHQQVQPMLEEIVAKFQHQNLKPYIVEEPMKVHDKPFPTVYNLYVHGIEKFNLIVMYVDSRDKGQNGKNYTNQLVNVIGKIHNISAKLVVVTDSIDTLRHNFHQYVESTNKRDRICDRTRIILPGLLPLN